MVITNFFQSIGKAKISIFLSLSRQMLFLVPLLTVLPRIVGLDGVWMSLPIADTTACLVSGTIMTRYIKKFKSEELRVKSEELRVKD